MAPGATLSREWDGIDVAGDLDAATGVTGNLAAGVAPERDLNTAVLGHNAACKAILP